MIAKLLLSIKKHLNQIFLIVFLLLIIFIDQISKNIALYAKNRYDIIILKNFFEIKTFFNYNLSFLNFIFLPVITYILTTLLFFIVFYKYIYRTLKKEEKISSAVLNIGSVLIISGAISNLIDRLKFGFVIDYFYIKWPIGTVFNIADITILIGSVLLMREIMKPTLR